MRYVPDVMLRLYDRSPVWTRSAGSTMYGWFKRRREQTPAFAKCLRELEESEFWSRGRLEELQAERLKAVVTHAARNVRYYRALFAEHGITASQIQGPSDLPRIPLLSKDTVRRRQLDLVTEGVDLRRVRAESTSGTTGSPLTIHIDTATYDSHRAAQWLHHRHAGYTHREWIGVFAGYRVLPSGRHRPPFWVTNHAGRQIHFSTYHLHPDWVPAFLAKMRRARLRFLLGYPSAIGLLAAEIARRGEYHQLDAVFLSSEPVFPWQEDAIRSAFGARLCHYYGTTERTVAALSCVEGGESGAMHITSELSIGEIVADASGGRLVGTSLTNFTMPLLRYEAGDVTEFLGGSCPCGRAHPRIAPVQTRTADFLVTPAGVLLSPWLVTRVFSPESSVSGFQIIQRPGGALHIRVIPGAGYGGEIEARLRAKIAEQMGPGVQMSFERVSSIERTTAGKVRVVVSESAQGRMVAGGEAHAR